jgi:hypothetical protein
MTDEHVWPEWLSKEWRTRRGNRPYTGTIQVHGPNVARILNLKLSTKTLNRKIGPVCRKCNNNTLSNLETKIMRVIAPMTYGQTTKLSPDDQTNLSAWITRMAMVWDFEYSHSAGPYFSPVERKLFIETLKPSKYSWVWLGFFDSDVLRAAIAVIQNLNRETGEGFIIATGILGRLAFQFLSRRWNKPPSDDDVAIMMHPIVDRWARATQAIWPALGTETSWPAVEENLSLQSIRLFAERWGGRVGSDSFE